ncbi:MULTISPECIES: hypothetical protein [unclassified Shimia]|uniref:hypothetical protein n=1 Tax=unclassified Shimia TaxID=2630038 RepID=UPI001AD99A81|nr:MULTISPECIES: hypothetical protein [unclassified Shimia]MBO9472916.1 hypothetical protein [Shimia sp. R10_1]MDA5556611.1 hypothetical protein [Shimia sp. MMG029]
MRALLLALTCFASPLAAQCPTASDMETGIRLEDKDGAMETYQSFGANHVRGLWEDTTGIQSKYVLLKGLYIVEQFDLEDGNAIPDSRATHSYPISPEDAPLPVAGGRWDTKVVTMDTEGVESRVESYVFGDTTRITLGGCSYDMIPVTGIYYDDDGYEETLHYLPELGFSYLSEARYTNEAPDRYVYVDIKAVP